MTEHEAQRLAAFSAFDLDGSGAISQHDARYAFQGVDTIGTLVDEKDIQVAMRREGVKQGQMLQFAEFCRICDQVEEFRRPHKQRADIASQIPLEEQDEERDYVQRSPRRSTRSVPRADWTNAGDDYPFLAGPSDQVHPDPLPTSPTSPRACLGDQPDMDAVAHAFYLFDTDFSGAVSGCELPNMLRLVPRGSWNQGQWERVAAKGRKTLARPGDGEGGGTGKALKKAQASWDKVLVRALDAIGKEYSDLLNIHDFQMVVDLLDPPPEPRQPGQTSADDGYETTESEKERRAQEEEQRRREEEARLEWEKLMGGTLIVEMHDGSYLKLLCIDADDKVRSIQDKVGEQTGREGCEMRLLGKGYELDPRKKLSDYGIKVGAPWHLVPPGGPFVWDDGDILKLLWREQPAPDQDDDVLTGWLQVRLWEGSRIQVWCEDDEPIEHIQRRIVEQVQAPPTQQRLVVHGREMNARKTLRDYRVALGPAGDVVDLLLRDEPAEPQRLSYYASPGRIM
eukprot:TRINITY_DN7529_c1_g1_i1.p1 TRINITY_DN7529_c1_g1~~TRINITY_DN7529_c1_g1_i1.p1  ORF type:complete len:565 (+),score=192.30 TRINITY_DN7529_c1_g1_i1:168-1697(+)